MGGAADWRRDALTQPTRNNLPPLKVTGHGPVSQWPPLDRRASRRRSLLKRGERWRSDEGDWTSVSSKARPFLFLLFLITGAGLLVGIIFAKQRQLLPPFFAENLTPALALLWAVLTWLELTGDLRAEAVRPLSSQHGTVILSVLMGLLALGLVVATIRLRVPVIVTCDGSSLRFGDADRNTLVDCNSPVWMSPGGKVILDGPDHDRTIVAVSQLERVQGDWYKAPEQFRRKSTWSCRIQSGPNLGDDPMICRASEIKPNWRRALHWKLEVTSRAWKRGFDGLTLVATSKDTRRNSVALQSYSSACSIALGSAREDLVGEHAWALDPICWEGTTEDKTLTFDLYVCESSPGLRLPSSAGQLVTLKMTHAQEASDIDCTH